MAYTNINKPSNYFNTKLYTGTGATQSITGVGFQPDFLWLKDRSSGGTHVLVDVIRGSTKWLASDQTSGEVTRADQVTSFDSDGFSLGADSGNFINVNGNNNVAWNWLAGGTGVSNTDGSITSTVSANTTSGFSIVKYTGNSTAGTTVGHGLSSAPAWVVVKSTGGVTDWYAYHKTLGNSTVVYLNLNNTPDASTNWNNTSPTSSFFTIGGGGAVNASGVTYVAYCFAEKKGFSKFGSYTGNGSTDGTFVYTGFKPAFVLIKCSSAIGDWQLIDSTRSTFNVCNLRLQPNLSDGEAGSDTIDICSNGFKQRNTFGNFNTSGATYIYMAFAENPLVSSSGVPCTAR